MTDEAQNKDLDGLDAPVLAAMASAMGIEFTPKARVATLRALIGCKREQDAKREAERPAREAAERLEAERQREHRARRVLREQSVREAREQRQPLNPAEIIDRRAETLRHRAERVRTFLRGVDTKHECYDSDGSDDDYLRMVRREVEMFARGVEILQRAVERADALRDGLASKPTRQETARARLRLAQAEHELASARLSAMAPDELPEAPRRRSGIVLKRSLSGAAQ